MSDLAVAMVHYHLRGGGVTRVIELALSALEAPGGARAVVLSGEAPREGTLPEGTRVAVVPQLGYGSTGGGAEGVRAARAAAVAALGRAPDVWHLHNHCLGKNLTLAMLAADLAASGQKVLLQIHDFAEDWRPSGYRLLLDACGQDVDALSRMLYPLAPNVSYAVLNSRDAAMLQSAGAPPDAVHLLANAVRVPRAADPEEVSAVRRTLASSAGRLFLYPVRPIRRKNLGELLLHALTAEGEAALAVTLEPQNPAERPAYEAWCAVALELGLPVSFGASRHGSLVTLLAASDAVLSTSVAEGFGLAFIEPWLAGREFRGRNLPEVTRDLTAAGLELPGTYDRLDVPVDWVGLADLAGRVEARLREAYLTCGLPAGGDLTRRALREMVRDGDVDFGSLDEELQARVLRRLAGDRAARARVAGTLWGVGKAGQPVIDRNRALIRDRFGENRYRASLLEVYRSLGAPGSGRAGHLDGGVLRQSFLRPERMRLLRS